MTLSDYSNNESPWSKEELQKYRIKKESKLWNKIYGVSLFGLGATAGVLLLAGSILYSRTNKAQSPIKFLDTNKDGIISNTEKNLFYKNMDELIGSNAEKNLFYKKIEQLVNDYNFWKP